MQGRDSFDQRQSDPKPAVEERQILLGRSKQREHVRQQGLIHSGSLVFDLEPNAATDQAAADPIVGQMPGQAVILTGLA
ncbi:hypothetical protein [Massilia sp. 9I]|uniref:hypothetical protein n=1 Tax=Massilia sp. 9I TaxID=2653152 RepID=UPI0012F13027|nr:hypothetical protein [Massilia sp. 9I]VXB97517.1 hypothetical protein MASSI9I_50816 [Massilia sp. 9I]